MSRYVHTTQDYSISFDLDDVVAVEREYHRVFLHIKEYTSDRSKVIVIKCEADFLAEKLYAKIYSERWPVKLESL